MLSRFDDNEDDDDHHDGHYYQGREQPHPDSLIPWALVVLIARVSLLGRERAKRTRLRGVEEWGGLEGGRRAFVEIARRGEGVPVAEGVDGVHPDGQGLGRVRIGHDSLEKRKAKYNVRNERTPAARV